MRNTYSDAEPSNHRHQDAGIDVIDGALGRRGRHNSCLDNDAGTCCDGSAELWSRFGIRSKHTDED